MTRRKRSSALLLGALVGLTTLAVAEPSAEAAVAYVRSTVGQPWSSSTNEQAMDMVFGAGGWNDLRYETVFPGSLLSPTYTFIYMDGSDDNAIELAAFLTANSAAINAWVTAGGRLFLNAGPNEGGNINFGFGVTLTYPGYPVDPGMAADATHPIWTGPHLPTSPMGFTGSSFAHADVSGVGLIPLIIDSDGGNPHLAEVPPVGSGRVIVGGLTTSNFWTPAPEALNLRANVIEYLIADDTDGDGIVDTMDNCVDDPNPMQEDADMDGLGDACDDCPTDPDNDADMDMACDDVDNCLGLSNPTQTDGDMDGMGDACDDCPADPDNDVDMDSVCGDIDNCPDDSNVNQADDDADGVGNVCDPCETDTENDADGDGVCESDDNCPADANDDQADADGDGAGDACDSCPDDADNDVDGDGVCGDVDNCPDDANDDQADADGDGIGDACDAASDSTGGDPTGGVDTDGATGGALTGLSGVPPLEPSGCACTAGDDDREGNRAWWAMVIVVTLARRRRRRAA